MNQSEIPKVQLKELEKEYQAIRSLSLKFCEELKKQLNELITQNNISLAFPIESRVKEWLSLGHKLESFSTGLKTIKDVTDLIGLRIILLFRSDLNKVYKLIEGNFKIIEKEDTQGRLRENEFGYLSVHYIIELPESWFAVPTFASLHGFKAEIQVRTAAQHIWATASHKLQYKQEVGVPIPVRRSIHRVSALLETVDLELDRVLDNRAEYIEQFNQIKEDDLLNVDLLKYILDEKLPKDNFKGDENFAELLEDLINFGCNTPSKLKEILNKHITAILEEDEKAVNRIRKDREKAPYGEVDMERINKGVFFTYAGLTRNALGIEFGKEWKKYMESKRTKKQSD